MNKYVIYLNKQGRYYFVLTARNGTVLFRSNSYASLAAAYNGIESVKAHAHTDVVEEEFKRIKNGKSISLGSS